MNDGEVQIFEKLIQDQNEFIENILIEMKSVYAELDTVKNSFRNLESEIVSFLDEVDHNG